MTGPGKSDPARPERTASPVRSSQPVPTIPVAQRLSPPRVESFGSLDVADDIQSPSPNEETSTLLEKNVQLQQQIHHLQAQLALLQKQQQGPPNSPSPSSVLIEMPQTLKAANKSSKVGVLSCFSRNNGGAVARNPNLPKDHRSVSTADEQETVVVEELEAHPSRGGLHHRHPYQHHHDSLSSSTDEGMVEMMERQDLLQRADAACDNVDGILQECNPNDLQNEDVWQCISDRAGWLVGLLVLQSMSSFIIARNEDLLQKHLVIVRFLTMLVGAGGNAGNQASVRVIRGLAVGSIDPAHCIPFLRKEIFMGAVLSVILGCAGCLRAAVFMTPWVETFAITTSLFMIVMISVLLGALLPLCMQYIGLDPAHSSTTIQVVMDILGVLITVHVSGWTLDSGFQDWLKSLFGGG